jgi:hypothetical protein
MNMPSRINLFFLCCFLTFIGFSQSQRTSIGFYYGPLIGYNAVYAHNANYNEPGLLDFNFNTGESFFDGVGMFNDTDLSNNVEMINGSVIGIKASLPVISGISIQPEIQYEQIDFNHILYQKGDAVFNDLIFGFSGLSDSDQYKIANYFWRAHYINFPFLIKLYATKNLFLEFGCKFGVLVKAEESPALARFNLNNEYVGYDVLFSEKVIYDFFDANADPDNHGYDINEWPFNWNASLITGFGYETKSFSFSLRYSMGLLNFFREMPDKEGDFFENYNVEFDEDVFQSFIISDPVINNNFKLHVISLTVGYHISN